MKADFFVAKKTVLIYNKPTVCPFAFLEDSMRVRIIVLPRPDVLDPVGKVIKAALHQLNHTKVEKIAIGRCYDFDLPAGTDRTEFEEQIRGDPMFGNPLIQITKFEYDP